MIVISADNGSREALRRAVGQKGLDLQEEYDVLDCLGLLVDER